PARAVRALRLVLHVPPLLRGAPAHRAGAPPPAAAGGRLGLDRRVRVLDGLLRLVAVLPEARRGDPDREAAARDSDRPGDGSPARPRPPSPLASRFVELRELELDLDAFEGPFDLLLTLVLKDELRPGE